MLKWLYLSLILVFLSTNCFAQSVVDTFTDGSDQQNPVELAIEQILKISESRRVFIITNSQDSFSKGDFITILIDNKPINRAIVAKIEGQTAGIKITKIYSLELFNSLRAGMTVQVLKGDDSYYRQKKTEGDNNESKIDDEDNLFDETTILEEDITSNDERKKYLIKNDNLMSFGIGFVDGVDDTGAQGKNLQVNFNYAYQIDANIWLEGFYGFHTMKNFPRDTIDTAISHYALRVKYTIALPFYSFLQPYFGYQIISPYSPGAGNRDDGDTTEANKEIAAVDEYKKNEPIFGVTVLKRLVPGWFVKVDIGTDIVNGGLTLEF